MSVYCGIVPTRTPGSAVRTKEEQFMLGRSNDYVFIDTLPERGRVCTPEDIDKIRSMIKKCECSVVDVMREYFLARRSTVYMILGMNDPVLVLPVSGKAQNQEADAKLHECDTISEIISLYNEAEIPTYLIAKRHGITQAEVRRILKKNGVKMDRSRRRIPRLCPDEKKAIDLWRGKGLSPREISQKLNIDEGQVRRYIQKTFLPKV